MKDGRIADLSPRAAIAPEHPPFRDEVEDTAVVVVHSLAHAVGALKAAARAGCRIILASAPEAGIYAGPGWSGAVVAKAREAVPDARCFAILDCGGRPGATLAAMRARIEGVAFTGRADVARRLADIANQHGVRLFRGRPRAALDLGEIFFASEQESAERCAVFFDRVFSTALAGGAIDRFEERRAAPAAGQGTDGEARRIGDS